ncbi:MAG: orotidine-5'-phosphate decarboxylase [Chlorobi bacterium]|nr:orotidine-5'-phosphate decarboxylase [Chlorobiota bacterium]
MTFNKRYSNLLETNGTRLCVGLDTDLAWIPDHLQAESNPILAFNKAIIEATSDLCSAYKMNLAFYESAGMKGMEALQGTLEAIPEHIITIGDAKRGDIGNTADHYAQAMFEFWGFDGLTVNPYMGTDTLETYFRYEGKCIFVLALTSNPGSAQFQRITTDGKPLYVNVIDRCLEEFGVRDQLGFVVGATHPNKLGKVRSRVGPNIPLLIPGVGTQGGDAGGTVKANDGGVAFVNVSRGISKAGSGEDFVQKAREATLDFVAQLAKEDPDARVRMAEAAL